MFLVGFQNESFWRTEGRHGAWCSGTRPVPTLSPGLSTGAIHLEFHSSGNHYVWRKVTSTVHNIIVGKLWIDQVSACGLFGERGSVGPGLVWGVLLGPVMPWGWREWSGEQM